MTTLTPSKIIQDNNYKTAAALHSVFMLAGIFVTFGTLIYTRRLDLNALIGTVFCFVVFGIPFGYFMGFRRVRINLDKMRKIKNGKYELKKDLLVKKEVYPDQSRNGHFVEFRDWSAKTDKQFRANRGKFDTLKEKKEYYLVFIDGYDMPEGIYDTDEYAWSCDEQE